MPDFIDREILNLILHITNNCIDSDNEHRILNDTLEACLKELRGNKEALGRISVAALDAIEDTNEEFICVDGDIEKLKSIHTSFVSI